MKPLQVREDGLLSAEKGLVYQLDTYVDVMVKTKQKFRGET